MNISAAPGMLVALVVAGLGCAPALAADGCPDPRSREFDFWLGEWDVTNREGGQPVGTNRIEPILDGCVLQETWRGSSGSAGSSLNFFDTQRQRWRQFWVWREGTTLELEGGFRDGRMVLEGESAEGTTRLRNRITWSTNPDGTVRQVWEVSADGARTWRTEFDGLYRKRAPR